MRQIPKRDERGAGDPEDEVKDHPSVSASSQQLLDGRGVRLAARLLHDLAGQEPDGLVLAGPHVGDRRPGSPR